ncbi:MAG: hypothetical protein WBQ08_09690 [Candidatus Sulfotelmatobacter sp.]
MVLVHVPRPKNAMDPDRPVNALLKAQMLHLHDAESKLPMRHHTDIYINAIKTEGEAANYVRRVTEAIHEAHAVAAAKRAKPVAKRKRVIEIAAVADDRPVRRTRVASTTRKKSKGKLGRKT